MKDDTRKDYHPEDVPVNPHPGKDTHPENIPNQETPENPEVEP